MSVAILSSRQELESVAQGVADDPQSVVTDILEVPAGAETPGGWAMAHTRVLLTEPDPAPAQAVQATASVVTPEAPIPAPIPLMMAKRARRGRKPESVLVPRRQVFWRAGVSVVAMAAAASVSVLVLLKDGEVPKDAKPVAA
jgi:hypothetical protein